MVVLKNVLLNIFKILEVYSLFAILFAFLLFWVRHKVGKKNNLEVFLFYIYLFFIYSLTVISRIVEDRVRTIDYLGIKPLFENPWYVVSFVENIIMFILFGILYMLAFKNENAIKQNIICAFIISLSIEVLQGIFHLGEAQIIDIIANVMGAWIGGMCIEKFRLYKERKDRRDGIG